MKVIDRLRKTIVDKALCRLDEQPPSGKNPVVVEIAARLITRPELADAHRAGYKLHYLQHLDYQEAAAATAALELREGVMTGMAVQEINLNRTRELVIGIPGPLPDPYHPDKLRPGRAVRLSLLHR